ncbi:IS3 family transposase [Flaviaesturariibacter aridisoli]|uniref:IS3 family transposase n=2 Tax=Flaviaesturariibacter aridisoli TaxID=2545761 RepID=A0A4R4DVI7_9BACT|nr:IS3 family transposase [Flaviaesturariibacter aridisoli]TCZ73751.1 IS3 family transposase [Flaviaesturariibacter aridisoli]
MSTSGQSRKRKSQKDYTLSFKLQVVAQIEKGEFTYLQAQRHYGIQGKTTVLVWLRKLGTLQWKTRSRMEKAEKTPEQRIKELEAALQWERDKNLLLETTIEVAEKQFGNRVAKKVARQAAQTLQTQGRLSLSRACRLLGISRQAFYQQRSRNEVRALRLAPVRHLVQEKRQLMPRLGTRKLHYLLAPELKTRGLKLGRDALFDYLRGEHLLVQPRKCYTKTTNSKHWLRKHPNRTEGLELTRPEQLWVADITYVTTKENTAYLSLITDAYSRKIVGHFVSDSLATEGVACALKTALKQRKANLPLIHHSDRGIQYCAAPYQEVLQSGNVLCSMTQGGDCYQNALAERINGILKDEFLLTPCPDLQSLRTVVAQSIHIYNTQRPHLSLHYKTPNFIHEKSLEAISNQGSKNNLKTVNLF